MKVFSKWKYWGSRNPICLTAASIEQGLSFVIWYSNVDTRLEDYRKEALPDLIVPVRSNSDFHI